MNVGTRETLGEVAAIVRSKNSGPFELTFDIMFDDEATYRRVVESQVLTPQVVCDLYHLDPKKLLYFGSFDPALAIKFTIVRPIDSGSVGETDTYGCQQHAPLMGLEVPAR